MPSDELSVPLAEGSFRERRVYLSPEAFALPGDGIQPPTDLIDPDRWMHLMDLPTDVALQTTDHFGTTFRAMSALSDLWISAIDPEPDLPLGFDAYLDAYDEFEAAPFIAVHGWYRQANAGLRNALEAMAHAARYTFRDEPDKYTAWRDGTIEPKFGNSVELIGADQSVAATEAALPGAALFGKQGVMSDLYRDVSHFAHGRPGHTNVDLWEGSNGPIYVPESFVQLWRNFRDTYLACAILLKLAYPQLQRPADLLQVAAHAGPPWHDLATAAIAAYFP
jgi:hypothetical protein